MYISDVMNFCWV